MTKPKRTFHQQLVLNRWVLSLFEMTSVQNFKHRLGLDAERFEGLADDGHTRFYEELKNFADLKSITSDDLLRYDLNIVSYWDKITEKRNKEGQTLNMKYFQYLSLLFTEIYLDWYFNRPEELLIALNQTLESHQKEKGALKLSPYTKDELSKIAFWSATGSGKTLLLHVNIHQYLHYYEAKHGKKYPDKIIVLTPNEGLSQQHLKELHLSRFHAELFNKDKTIPDPEVVEVIDIHKLSDKMGDKTVAVDAFEGDNLVLVDEGHRGTSSYGGKWLERREKLVSQGFAFEYSATFGQAIGDTAKERKLAKADVNQVYSKCILFDYSYKYFYEDGYGKDSLILNMDKKGYERHGNQYFTACLLSFYQQQWLWGNNPGLVREYQIAKPLWAFVGHTVTGGKISNKDEKAAASDVLKVVDFLGWFLNNPDQVKVWLKELLQNKASIVDSKDTSIFHDRFAVLNSFSNKVGELYADILLRVFNSAERQQLRLVNLRGSDGELVLRVGNAEPFGLINIGDDSGFFNRAQEFEGEYLTERDDFGTGLFGTINNEDSKLNVLIGARKFTEGWSSWRVSTMGLLNIGQNKGAQIIQMFGRGIRLKGKDFSLKRTTPDERELPPLTGTFFEKLETLNIFGVAADYMAEFKKYLKEEGVTPSDEILELDFRTRENPRQHRLKTLQLKDGYKDNQKKGFKRTQYPALYKIPDEFRGKIKAVPPAVLDRYPRVTALATAGAQSVDATSRKEENRLADSARAFFDWDRVYLALHRYKLERTWSNLQIDKQRLRKFCARDDWYTLLIPKSELELTAFDRVRYQEDILIQLLKNYTDNFYNTLKTAYEGQFMETTFVNDDHPSLLRSYIIQFDDTAIGQSHKERFEQLQKIVENDELQKAAQWGEDAEQGVVAISFKPHLYYPLLSIIDNKQLPIKIRPMAFDAPSEVQFIRDLDAYYQSNEGRRQLGKRSLYLLRNPSNRSKGLGFTFAGSFYPDYLLWLVDDETNEQWLSFIDPKGIRNMNLVGSSDSGTPQDPKLGLYKEIKELEDTLNNDGAANTRLHLNSFILSATDFNDLLNSGGVFTEKDLEDKNVFFMNDKSNAPSEHYLRKMFDKILAK